MKIEVTTYIAATNVTDKFELEGLTIAAMFRRIPIVAARRGSGLLNDGSPVNYTVRVIEP